MTNDRSLDEICRLLLTFSGVTSAFGYRSNDPPEVFFRFRCTNTESLKVIASTAGWANFRIHLSSFEMRLCGELQASSDLPCDMKIPDGDSRTPTQAEIFGVYLAEELRRKRLISEEKCDRLHSMWNANPRSSKAP